MKPTAAMSIAALVAPLVATPALALDLGADNRLDAAVKSHWSDHQVPGAAINANAALKAWPSSHDIDANSVLAIATSADGSVHVYEG